MADGDMFELVQGIFKEDPRDADPAIVGGNFMGLGAAKDWYFCPSEVREDMNEPLKARDTWKDLSANACNIISLGALSPADERVQTCKKSQHGLGPHPNLNETVPSSLVDELGKCGRSAPERNEIREAASQKETSSLPGHTSEPDQVLGKASQNQDISRSQMIGNLPVEGLRTESSHKTTGRYRSTVAKTFVSLPTGTPSLVEADYSSSLLFPAGLYEMPRTMVFPTAHEALTSLSLMLRRVPERHARQGTTSSITLRESSPEYAPIAMHGGRRARESAPRYTKDARVSNFCHICGRRRRDAKPSCDDGDSTTTVVAEKRRGGQSSTATVDDFFAECSNREVGLCRKAICGRCIRDHDLARLDEAKDQNTPWACLHCMGNCPPIARCQYYMRHNAIRRARNQRSRAATTHAGRTVG